MEDYAPILWVLLVVGSLIASGVSKARKQMRKERESADSAPESEQIPLPEDRMQPHIPLGMEREKPRKIFTYDDQMPDTTFTYEDATSGTIFTSEEINSDELFSYEDATSPEAEMPLTGDSGRYSATSGTIAPNTPDKAEITDSKEPGDKTGAEIAQEFDLRKAVIYSEILKPKFSE